MCTCNTDRRAMKGRAFSLNEGKAAGIKKIGHARLIISGLLTDEQLYHMDKDAAIELLEMVVKLLRKGERQIRRFDTADLPGNDRPA